MTEPNPDLVLFRRKYYWQYALVIGALSLAPANVAR